MILTKYYTYKELRDILNNFLAIHPEESDIEIDELKFDIGGEKTFVPKFKEDSINIEIE